MPLTPSIVPLQIGGGAVAVVFAVGLLIGGGAAFFGLRSRDEGGDEDVDPEKVRQLAEGDRVTFDDDTEVGEALNDLADEVSKTEGTVTVNREALESAFGHYEQALNEFSDGDFTKRVSTDTGIQLVDELGEEINHSLEEVEENIRYVQRIGRDMAADTAAAADSAEEIHETSEGISSGVNIIRDDVTEQMDALDEAMDELQSVSASVEEVAASADRVASTAAQTAQTGSEGREAAQEAMGGLHEIQQSADEAVETIERLDEKMDEISEIAEVIGQIAEQTNMLAINAGIEASRAGEAGEGFGVVADEVKQLADETAERANEIEETLAEVEDESKEAVEQVVTTQEQVESHREAIEDAINSLDEVAELVDRTNEGIQEISQATDDQSEATQVAVERVDRAVNTNEEVLDEVEDITNATERQTDAISSHLTTLQQRADQLRDTLNMFNVGDIDEDGITDVEDIEDVEDVHIDEDEDELSGAEVEDDDLQTRTGSGFSKAGDSREAGAEAAQSAKAELDVDRVDFAQVFVSPDYEDEDVIDGVYGVVGEDTEVIGATTAGEFTEDGLVDGGVVVGLVASDTIQFYTGIGTGLSESVSSAVDEAIESFPEEVDGHPHLTAINLHDGLSGKGDRVALNTRRKLGPEVSFAGGMAGDNFQLDETRVYCGDRVETDAVALALLACKNEPFISASHAHEPIGDTYKVTSAEGGVVHELDGQPAVEVWKQEVDKDIDDDIDEFIAGLGEEELASLFGVYEMGMAEQQADGTVEYRVRWPGLTDPSTGSLTFATEIEEGAELAVMKSDPESQLEAAKEVGDRVRKSIDGDLAGAFVYECACRSLILGDDFDEAVTNLDEELDVPFAGFETYGELCQQLGEPSGFHNTTSVVLGLPE